MEEQEEPMIGLIGLLRYDEKRSSIASKLYESQMLFL